MQMLRRVMTRYLPGMLTCQDIDNYLYDYFDGKLSRTEHLKFTLHLSMCSQCRCYVNQYKATILGVRSTLPENDETVEMPDELVQLILKNKLDKS